MTVGIMKISDPVIQAVRSAKICGEGLKIKQQQQ